MRPGRAVHGEAGGRGARAARRVSPHALGILLLALGALQAAGCLRPASERAERDLEVGQGTAGGVTFEVEGGLAAIRRLEPGRIELWAQAPLLEVRARSAPGATATWLLVVENACPDSVLVARSGVSTSTRLVEPPGSPATRRSFALSLARAAEARFSVGPPDASAPGSLRFAIINDLHVRTDDASDLRDAITLLDTDGALRFVLSAGDITQAGEEAELARVQEELRALRVPFYATVGNHEVSPFGESAWPERFGRHSSHFWFAGVCFSLVDSSTATIDPTVYGWLDEWLAGARGRPHVFVTHMPVIDPVGTRNASFRSRKEAGKLLARLAGGRVDLVLHGHVHSFYAFFEGGIPAYISAAGGPMTEKLDDIGRTLLLVDIGPGGVKEVERVELSD